jgi:hypothetical protein
MIVILSQRFIEHHCWTKYRKTHEGLVVVTRREMLQEGERGKKGNLRRRNGTGERRQKSEEKNWNEKNLWNRGGDNGGGREMELREEVLRDDGMVKCADWRRQHLDADSSGEIPHDQKRRRHPPPFGRGSTDLTSGDIRAVDRWVRFHLSMSRSYVRRSSSPPFDVFLDVCLRLFCSSSINWKCEMGLQPWSCTRTK